MVGQRVLARAADEQFNELRGVNKIAERTAAMERTRYLEGRDSPPIITSYEWIGLATIASHNYSSTRALDTASDRVKRKAELGKLFLGVLHSDVGFTDPPLPAGTYAITYQRGFSNADIMFWLSSPMARCAKPPSNYFQITHCSRVLTQPLRRQPSTTKVLILLSRPRPSTGSMPPPSRLRQRAFSSPAGRSH